MKGKKTVAEITGTLKKHEKELNRRFGVKRIGIFGSYIRNEAKGESDLDILIEFEHDMDRKGNIERGCLYMKREVSRNTLERYGWNEK